MLRTFKTHEIRFQQELTGLWDFLPATGAGLRVAVPSCWETYPGFEQYRGRADYSTSFEGKGNIRVVCKGVSHTAQVFVDGVMVTKHYNAYTPFSGVLKGAKEGEHSLRIRVSNAFSQESALHVPNDYMTYGGINRPVAVETVPDVYIEWVHATPFLTDDTWHLKIEALVRNIGEQAHDVRLKSFIKNAQADFGSLTAEPGTDTLFSAETAVSEAETYWPEKPELYFLKTLLYADGIDTPSDDLIERVGFREVTVQGKSILLNGKPLHIKGLCRHEDHPNFGSALPFAAMDYDLRVMKDLGANAVRTSHYPNDELFLDLCDERGILVWEENHARGLSEEQMRNPNFRKQCLDCIREMTAAHFNHPSIIIWGVMNECASHTEYGKECYAEQLALLKATDPSRPVSFASCQFFKDICLGLVDIVSYNIYPEWYHNTPAAEYLRKTYDWVQTETEGAGKPFLITEIGAGGIYGNHNARKSMWSEERQAELLTHQLDAVLSCDGCSGVFIWQFCDIRISEEFFMNRPRTMNNKGIVDEFRRPKLSYEVVKKFFK